MASPKLYVDLLSQPSRACVIFCRQHRLPVDVVLLSIGKGEHRTPEFMAKFPLAKVPLLEDGELVLPESTAILGYLAGKYRTMVPEHWLPPSDNPADRAAVEAALSWYHPNLRLGAREVVFNNVIAPLRKLPANDALASYGVTVLNTALRGIEEYWLRGGAEWRRYLNNRPEISAADLLYACEIEQLCLLGKAQHGTDMETLLAPYPAVRQWLGAVRQQLQPDYDEVTDTLRKLAVRTAGPRTKSSL